jgi:uncharacterized membrane protein YcaP (DUF421 family)
MSIPEILGAPWTDVWAAVVSTLAIYGLVILATRLLGLRTFAKMSSFDFAATIATGSILASVSLTSAPLSLGAVAIFVLFFAQGVVSTLRRGRLDRYVDNSPVLLMDGQQVLEDNMRRANVTDEDLYAKLREANVTRMEQVRAVVLETTGDVSVLHADPDAPPLDDILLTGVRREAFGRPI